MKYIVPDSIRMRSCKKQDLIRMFIFYSLWAGTAAGSPAIVTHKKGTRNVFRVPFGIPFLCQPERETFRINSI